MPLNIQLLPQENRFFELLHEAGEQAYASVNLLSSLVVETDRAKAEKLGQDIEAAKEKAKRSMQEISEMLCKTFITPFDRQDIHDLARALYKIPKIAEKAQERILSFYLVPMEGDFVRLTDNVSSAAGHLQYLLKNLQTLKVNAEMHERCTQIHNIEAQTDTLLNALTVTLYQNEHDIKQLLLRQEVYAMMESLVDRHRDLSNTMLEIVLKHS